MSDGGPKTYREFHRIPKNVVLDVTTIPLEDEYNSGVAEGRRYEREKKLLEVATAAMNGMLAGGGGVSADIIHDAWDFAKRMLAEADRRRDEK